MPTPKDAIKNAKLDLSWIENDPNYTAWRNQVKVYCSAKNIRSKTQAGTDAWTALTNAAKNFDGFRRLAKLQIDNNSKQHKAALQTLLMDCLKKCNETDKNLQVKRALKRAREDADSDVEKNNSDEAGPGPGGKPVALYLLDPQLPSHRSGVPPEWTWNNRDTRKLGILKDPSLNAIWEEAGKYVPAGRHVREILGSLQDLAVGANQPTDWVRLEQDSEVAAFLRITRAKPIRILIILARDPINEVPDTPLIGGQTYFPADRFDPPEEYDDPCEDSDALMRNRLGLAKRRMPTVDHAFEERKRLIRKRIKRQIELLNKISEAHRAKFPNLDIYEPGSEEWAQMQLFVPKLTCGVDIVNARRSVIFGKEVCHMAHAGGDNLRVSKLRGLLAACRHWAKHHAN